MTEKLDVVGISISTEGAIDQVDVESLRIAVHEMRVLFQQRLETADAIDRKADALLASASLVLALISTLQLALLGVGQSLIYWLGLGLVFVLYIGLIALASLTLTPESYATPIEANWEVLDQFE